MLQDITIGLKMAILLILIMMLYMFSVTFFPVPQIGNEHAKTITPFLLGIIATLIGFYWGNSKKKDDPPIITQVDRKAIEAAKVKAEEVVKETKEGLNP